MKTYKLTKEIELTEEQMKDIVKAYNKPEFEYPILKINKNNGAIIKFMDIDDGTVIWKGKSTIRVGHKSSCWNKHTDTDIWEDVPYDKDRDFWHGQPIFCRDNDDSHQRVIRFYDAINKCTFRWKGKINGTTFHNYEAVPQNEYKNWMIEAFNTLERAIKT